MLNTVCCVFLAMATVPPDVVNGEGSPKAPVDQSPRKDDPLKALLRKPLRFVLQKQMPVFFREMSVPASGPWDAEQQRLVLAELAWRQAAEALQCRDRSLISSVFQGMKPFIPEPGKKMVIPTIRTVNRQNVPVRQLGWVVWRMKGPNLFRSEVYAGVGPSDDGKSREPCWTLIGDGEYAREWTKDKDTGKYKKGLLDPTRLEAEACPQAVCGWPYYEGLIGRMDVEPAELWRMRIAGGTLEGLKADVNKKQRVCVSYRLGPFRDGAEILFRFYFNDSLDRIVQVDKITSSPAPDDSGRIAFLHQIWTYELKSDEAIPKAVFSFEQPKAAPSLPRTNRAHATPGRRSGPQY